MPDQPNAAIEAVAGGRRKPPYKVSEVAAKYRIDRSTVYRDIKAGRLVAYRIGRGRGTVRVPVEALAAYEALITEAARSGVAA